ncbi:MAG: zinc ribbon domain-containing protein, partial [Lachnospiraceae bacterium]|nr:zinc ribbon domain-containing protein [Lachnospiraceae bacterium]
MKYCEKCQEFREDRFMFCNKCGSPLIEKTEQTATEQSPEPGQFQCPNCGKMLSAGARFCTGCGTPVDQDMTQELPSYEQPVYPVYEEPVYTAYDEPVPPVYEEPGYPAYDEPAPQVYDEPYEEGRKGGKVALIVIVALIGAILLFAGSFLITEYFVYQTTPVDLFQKYILGESKEADSDEDEDEDASKEKKRQDEEKETETAEATAAAAAEEEVIAMPTPTPTPTPTPEPTPEPTPTPYVWPDWDLNFNAEQADVDASVQATRKTKSHYKKHDYGDTYFYTQDDHPVIIGAKKSVNEWKYDREYVGSSIYYVEMSDEVKTTMKFYFAEGKLFRVIDEKGVVHDYGEPGWEDY